jgi:hypothetical protein
MNQLLPALIALFTLCITGCSTGSMETEQAKLRRVQIGMSVIEVEGIMSTEDFIYRGDTYGRPMRVDKFSSKNGKPVSVYYYRSSLKREDGVATDDETTAVIFIDGKVDAITAGDFAKQSVEVRFR